MTADTSQDADVTVTESMTKEPVIREPQADRSLPWSWTPGEAGHLSAVAMPDAPVNAMDAGDEEPGLEL